MSITVPIAGAAMTQAWGTLSRQSVSLYPVHTPDPLHPKRRLLLFLTTQMMWSRQLWVVLTTPALPCNLHVSPISQVLQERRARCETQNTDPVVWTNQRVLKWVRDIDLKVRGNGGVGLVL